jgi:predicted RNase H-like nuclease
MNRESCLILGIDCATVPRKRGVSLAQFDERCSVESAAAHLSDAELVEMLALCKERGGRILLALDAPLGWPEPLGRRLMPHKAGESLPENAPALFRRETDRFVKRTYSVQSLDVGADRIARTAHSALELLGTFRKKTGSLITLADNEDFHGISAIEVYPAATLSVHGLQSRAYKNHEAVQARLDILEGLEALGIEISQSARSNAAESADALDAIVCVLAGMDFLKGDAHPPEHPDLAAKEGWIWVRRKSH